ncbi:MAG: O-methyltransferase [candidate division Zixibacteria bacterium]|jgi:predicted O-methyltransferase YrrM|nr:O-methyltransferase [candidate division Zixibacteria bacterium]
MTSKIEKYLHQVTPEREAVLREMEAFAEESDFPIIGPLVGRFLYQMAALTKARRVLELGSGFGYSAYWFSLAMKSKGHIVMTDVDKANKRRAFDYFQRAGLQNQFDFRIGDSRKVISTLDGPFDIILNDIDKQGYPATIDLVAPKLRKGGLFITDNVIWNGKVAERKQDEATRAIVEFTQNLYQDSRFFTTILPIRDGVAVALRV